MEKGFNDQELADIMSEIESLEREFAADAQTAPEVTPEAQAAVEAAPEPVEADPVVAEVEEVEEEPREVLTHLAHAPEEKTVLKTNYAETVVPFKQPAPVAVAPAPAPVAAPVASGTAAPASMSFQVQGEMTVNLAFCVNGQNVSLSVNTDGLCIETESGAKFTIPMQTKRKVA